MGSGNSSTKITFVDSETPEALLHAKSFNELYELGEEIGGGSFASVNKCLRKSDKLQFAAKMISKRHLTEKESIGLKNEIEILRKISHENVIKLIDVFDNGKIVTIVLELCDGNDLFDAIVASKNTRFTEQKSAQIIYKLSKVCQYLHERGIIHRDLKPENILFGMDGTLKITDFGLAYSSSVSWTTKSKSHKSNYFETIQMKTCCGTPHYVAPEIVKRKHYNYKCDIWSLGVICYIMLVGYQPFRGDSLNHIYKLIAAGKYNFKSKRWDSVSIHAKDFIQCLLQVHPKHRYNHNEIQSHPWIVKYINDNHCKFTNSPKSPVSP